MPALSEIAAYLDLEFRGDPALVLDGIASVEEAGTSQLSFVTKAQYLEQAESAGAVILHPDWADDWQGPCLLSPHPYLSYANATRLFDNRPVASGTVHPQAIVDPSARLGHCVTVDAGAVVAAGVVLGDGVWIGANAVVGQNTQIGENTRVYPGVVIYHGVSIGRDCTFHGNCVIGADGFGFSPSDQGWIKILQLGGVQIGDRVEIGASSTVDRGALTDTVIEDNVILDDQVHIGHNVRVGARTGMAACTGVGGSTVVGRDCTLAGMVGVGDHITIADNVHVNGQGRVSKSLLEPGVWASGTPIQPYRDWSKNAVRFEQLAQMARRISALEKQLAAMETGAATEEDDPS